MNLRLVLAMSVLALPGCETLENLRQSSAAREEQRRLEALRADAAAKHAVFRSTANWRKTTYRNPELIAAASASNTAVEISLSEQRGLLLVDGAIAMDFPIASGKKSHPTPTGSYTILDKQVTYSSNLYGKIFDAEGVVLNADADTRRDTVPEGGRFVGASMPYWMRLTPTGVGLHVGYVPGRPASHGCIRLQRAAAKEIFGVVRIGTPVTIADTAPSLATAPRKS